LTIDDAEVKANVAGTTEDDSYQINNSTIVTSEIFGRGFIYNAYIYRSYVSSTSSGVPVISGSPYKVDVIRSRVTCDAIVISDLTDEQVGCGYNHPPLYFQSNLKPRALVTRVIKEMKRESYLLNSEKIALEKKISNLLKLKSRMKVRQ
ncbi:MAG: hypothetical protein WDA09_06415, partial [Bacteriovoracaceae bacterium]